MLSHADLHAQPQEELSTEHREQIERTLKAQQAGVEWRGSQRIRFVQIGSILFVREDGSRLLPDAVTRAAIFGATGIATALAGAMMLDAGGPVGKGMLLIGAFCLGGCLWWLNRFPADREALRNGPTRHGIYLLEDAMLVLHKPVAVINRPEKCGAYMIPKGAITGVQMAEVRQEGDVHYVVSIRVRKTTGETISYPLDGYPTVTRDNELKTLFDAWLVR